MMAEERKQVRAFDVTLAQNVDHVVLYAGPDGIEAIPYYLRRVTDDGVSWYDETEDFSVTEEYRQAIAERTHVPVEDIELDRHIDVHGWI